MPNEDTHDKLYWHFIRSDGHFTRDLANVKAEVGQTLCRDEHDPMPCYYGLHASERALDALNYAPGTMACLVTLGGKIVHDKDDGDKVAAQRRTIVAMADVEKELHEFALWCAERALQHISNPDVTKAVLDAKRAWLRGEMDDDALDAAAEAVWDLAHSTSESDLVKFVAYTVYYAASRQAAEGAIYASSDACSAATCAADGEDDQLEDAAHYAKLDAMLREALGVSEPADTLSS